jgi:ankyrin repeat protein
VHASTGWTPALHAANLGHFDALNLLLEHGANLQALNEGGTSCFDEIVRDDAVDLLEAVWPEAQKFQLNQKK